MGWWPSHKVAAPGAGGVPSMRIGDLIDERTVLFFAKARPAKDPVIEKLIATVCAAHGLGDPAPLIAKVLERERSISTALDSGLSLPHARVKDLDRFVAGLAVIPEGVVEPKPEVSPVRLMLLLFSPESPDASAWHLQVLRKISMLFEASLVSELLAATRAEDVLSLIRRREG